jgi:hypothetical protein
MILVVGFFAGALLGALSGAVGALVWLGTVAAAVWRYKRRVVIRLSPTDTAEYHAALEWARKELDRLYPAGDPLPPPVPQPQEPANQENL